jgi:small subunit ribosomal protein S16
MLTIRLTRVGKKKDGSFRVVVVDSKRKVQAGNYLEMVGSYDPRVDKAELKAERITHWLSQGAKASDTVHNLLISKKIIEGKKINVLPRKSPPKVETAPIAPAAAAPDVAAETPAESVPEAQPEAPAEESVSSEVAEEAKTE